MAKTKVFTMSDIRFSDLLTTCNNVQSFGGNTIIFRESEHDKIFNALNERYNDVDKGNLQLRGVKFIFI